MQASLDKHELEEMLDELELHLKRLRIEYEQFFRGAMRREPSVLLGKVQKTISYFMSAPPRNSALKFRFNSLNARFQSHRQQWGRTLREMEAGTYKAHQFKLKLAEQERDEEMRQLAALEREEKALDARRAQSKSAVATPASPPAPTPAAAHTRRSGIDQLHDALMSARTRTGETGQALSRERLAAVVKQQTEAIRAKRGADAKVKFKVVIENNKAKLKATVA